MNTQDSPTPHLSLDELADQFSHWRMTRKGQRTAVPQYLRDATLRLQAHYKISTLIKKLGINTTMLKNWQESKIKTPSSQTFVPLHVKSPVDAQSTQPSTLSPSSSLEFTLTYAQGAQITLKGDFSLQQLTAIMQGLHPSSQAHS